MLHATGVQDPGMGSEGEIYFSSSLFNISKGYSVSLSFNIKQGAASQKGR
jgi:hypothetical protein